MSNHTKSLRLEWPHVVKDARGKPLAVFEYQLDAEQFVEQANSRGDRLTAENFKWPWTRVHIPRNQK